jgi:phosphatidate cytidylyltransferase
MNNFQTRLVSGIAYVGILCLGIFINEISGQLLMLLLSILAFREFRNLAVTKANYSAPKSSWLALVAIILWVNHDFYSHYISIPQGVWLLIIIAVLYGEWIFLLFKHKIESPRQFLTNILGYFYAVIPFALAPKFAKLSNIHGEYDSFFLFLFFLLIWSSDTFAYLVGRKLGKTKLFKEVSPKKTWEGFIGGGILTTILGIAIAYFHYPNQIIQVTLLSIIIFVIGSIGDLFQSSYKRKLEIKDSSNLIPGHGGILDRLDSFIFAMPFVYFFLVGLKDLM